MTPSAGDHCVAPKEVTMSNRSDAETRNGTAAEAQAASIPAELLLRRDHNIRYERNGTVYATDGRVGVLKQVVVDETSNEVAELIIKVDGSDRVVLLPPDLVDKTAGSAVFVTVNRVQFAERAAAAPLFERKEFAKVDAKALLKRSGDEARQVTTPVRCRRRPPPAR
jgi:hypothetical protein